MKSISLLLCSIVFFHHAYSADSTKYVFQTYVYKKAEANELKLDVFMPEKTVSGSKHYPVIILFHGGSWVSGDRSFMHWQCGYFAKQGVVAITADYRFMTQGSGGKEVCIKDAKSAVRWVKFHAHMLQIDTSKVILGGRSAGGHLATMAALNRIINDPGDDTAISTSAQALVLFNPAYSLNEDAGLQPFSLVHGSVPPAIMFFGSKDKWKVAADSLHNLLKQEGAPCEMWIANGETHAFFNKAPWNKATCVRAQEFLSRYGLIKRVVSISDIETLVKNE